MFRRSPLSTLYSLAPIYLADKLRRQYQPVSIQLASAVFVHVAIVMLVLWVGLVTERGYAQITSLTSNQATASLGVGHEYLGTINDIVNPANGSLSLRIDIPTPPGRGLSLPFHLDYNSNGVVQLEVGSNEVALGNGDLGFAEQNGWRYGLPSLSSTVINLPSNNSYHPGITCNVDTSFIFTDPTGSRHPLSIAVADVSFCENILYVTIDTPNVAQDQRGYSLSTQANATQVESVPFKVWDPSGTLYHFPNMSALVCSGTSQASGHCGVPDFIEDRNGNKIIFNPNAEAIFPLTVQDTVGRTVLSASGFGHTGDTINVSGMNAPFVINWQTVSWGYTPTVKSFIETIGSFSYCDLIVPYSGSGTMSVMSSIVDRTKPLTSFPMMQLTDF